MGFYRSIINGTPHSMSGGFYSSSWKNVETISYLKHFQLVQYASADSAIRYTDFIVNRTTDFSGISLSFDNIYYDGEPTYYNYNKGYPIFKTAATGKIYLNENSSHTFSGYVRNNWNFIDDFDFSLVKNADEMFNFSSFGTSGSGLNERGFTLPDNVVSCNNIFNGCTSFNGNVYMGRNIRYCRHMFYNCWNFNQNIQMPNSVYDCSYMFYNCCNLNQNIQIPNNAKVCSQMFYRCNTLNQNIQIPNNISSCLEMFHDCYTLNQNIQIPNNISSCTSIFCNCYNLNQNIQIPNNAKVCSSMFSGCNKLNQNIQIPNKVTNCRSMFFNCYRLNTHQNQYYVVNIPDTVIDCRDMFYNCASLNGFVRIPSTLVNNMSGMFGCCNSLNGITILKNSSGVTRNFTNLVRGRSNKKRLNIRVNKIDTSSITKTTATTSITGTAITWTKMTNGYYNATANIYIYNNSTD